MAAPTRSYSRKNGAWTFTNTFAASGGTMDMPALPGPALCWVIDSIWVYLAGAAATAMDVNVTEAGGNTIARIGTSAVAAAQPLPADMVIPGPIACLRNDQTKVVLASTGPTSSQLTVNAHLEPAN